MLDETKRALERERLLKSFPQQSPTAILLERLSLDRGLIFDGEAPIEDRLCAAYETISAIAFHHNEALANQTGASDYQGAVIAALEDTKRFCLLWGRHPEDAKDAEVMGEAADQLRQAIASGTSWTAPKAYIEQFGA